MSRITIITPSGMFGGGDGSAVSNMLCAIGEAFGEPGEWASKYGTRVENEVFTMHPYCWCERDDCPYCWDESERGKRHPNFHYKPTDLKVWWYKYIGRSMETNRPVTRKECANIAVHCMEQVLKMRCELVSRTPQPSAQPASAGGEEES
jgi:hypothetical protein